MVSSPNLEYMHLKLEVQTTSYVSQWCCQSMFLSGVAGTGNLFLIETTKALISSMWASDDRTEGQVTWTADLMAE